VEKVGYPRRRQEAPLRRQPRLTDEVSRGGADSTAHRDNRQEDRVAGSVTSRATYMAVDLGIDGFTR
jgi:hypothetical protein